MFVQLGGGHLKNLNISENLSSSKVPDETQSEQRNQQQNIRAHQTEKSFKNRSNLFGNADFISFWTISRSRKLKSVLPCCDRGSSAVLLSTHIRYLRVT